MKRRKHPAREKKIGELIATRIAWLKTRYKPNDPELLEVARIEGSTAMRSALVNSDRVLLYDEENIFAIMHQICLLLMDIDSVRRGNKFPRTFRSRRVNVGDIEQGLRLAGISDEKTISKIIKQTAAAMPASSPHERLAEYPARKTKGAASESLDGALNGWAVRAVGTLLPNQPSDVVALLALIDIHLDAKPVATLLMRERRKRESEGSNQVLQRPLP